MKRIAVFARPPVTGRVKTRLSPALPASLACELYRAMLEDALAAAAESGAGERLIYWAEPPGEPLSIPAGEGFETRFQSGPDLGARLEGAFSELICAPGDRAIVIGADCPMLDAAILRGAFEALAAHDLILGPTRDGGYYLVGLGRTAPELFRDIPWSTERVLARTRERAEGLGLTVLALEELEDLDTPEDLVRLVARAFSSGEPHGIRTAGALRAMGLLPAQSS